ncbi:MAG: DUF302 domain-containing protein [Verrucomicrobiota bacterium]
MSSTINRTSTKSIDQTCEDLQAAVSNHKFGVLTVHNLAQTMANKGVEFNGECRIFEVCNPHQAKKVLESNPEISTALPCRISVYTEGDTVKLSTISPSLMLGMFGADDIKAVADEVEETLTAIMDEAVN